MRKPIYDQSRHLGRNQSVSGALIMPTDARPSIVPPASTYQDLSAPYSAVSSFNVPAQCDSSLLTPISAAGSPPLHHLPKFAHRYNDPSDTPQQEPTPPASSSMYPWNGYVEDHQNHTGSPMNQNPSHEYAEQQPYLTDGRRTPGPPPEPYMGGYSVSNAAAEYHQGGVQSHNAPYYVPQIANHGLLDTPMHMGDPRVVAGAASAGASLPSQHTNPAYHHGHREGEAASPFSRTVEPRGDVGSPKRRATQAPNRVQKAQSNSARRKASTSRGTGQTFDPSEDNKNCLNQEVPPTLRDDCTGEELALFQLRWEHRDKKGDSMWDLIRSGLTERFDKPYEKEQVQMKYKRARSKYIVWLSEDEKLLEEAWREVEKSRYQLILDKFLELGGSRNMNASPSDIEAKLVVSHKFEKDIYIEDLQDIPVRRRRQPNPRNRRANGGRTDNEDNRLQGLQDQTIDEDEVIDQIHGRRGSRAMLSPEMMDMQTTDGQRFRTEPGVHHHHAGHGYAQQNGPRSPPNHGEYNQRRRV